MRDPQTVAAIINVLMVSSLIIGTKVFYLMSIDPTLGYVYTATFAFPVILFLLILGIAVLGYSVL